MIKETLGLGNILNNILGIDWLWRMLFLLFLSTSNSVSYKIHCYSERWGQLADLKSSHNIV